MTVIINGTTGITNVNGSAAAPAETGTDTDTGIVYGTNTVTIATNGTAGLVQNSVQGVQVPNTIGVGGTTPSTSGAGISFPATQSASSDSNTLDDYEEGTWTPFIGGANTDPTITYTARYGYYVKVGRMLFVSGYIYSNAGMSGGTGNVLLAGLPFTCIGGANGAYQFLPIGYNTFNGNTNSGWRWQMNGNLTYGPIYSSASGVNLPNTASTVEFSFSGVFETT